MFIRPIGADRAPGGSGRIFRIAVCRLKAGSTVIHQSFLSSPWRWMDVSRCAEQALSRSRAARLAVPLAVPMALGLTGPGDHPGGLGEARSTRRSSRPRRRTPPGWPAHRPVPPVTRLAGPVRLVRDDRPVPGSGYAVQFPGVAAEVTEMSGAATVSTGPRNELPSGPALTARCSALPLRSRSSSGTIRSSRRPTCPPVLSVTVIGSPRHREVVVDLGVGGRRG